VQQPAAKCLPRGLPRRPCPSGGVQGGAEQLDHRVRGQPGLHHHGRADLRGELPAQEHAAPARTCGLPCCAALRRQRPQAASRAACLAPAEAAAPGPRLRQVFSRVGDLKNIHMGLDKHNKSPCGFCFVEYYTRKVGRRARRRSSSQQQPAAARRHTPPFLAARCCGWLWSLGATWAHAPASASALRNASYLLPPPHHTRIPLPPPPPLRPPPRPQRSASSSSTAPWWTSGPSAST
jgi:hypothetical protein